MLLSFAAHAAMPLDEWRKQVVDVRSLAENDAPRAYREAQLLQKESPAAATPADRARVLNLLSRIELHLALISESVRHSAQARAVAKQANDADGQIEADLNISLGAINQARFDDMIDATQDGMALLEKVRREELRAEMMFQAAMMYLRFGQVEELVTVAMQGLEVARSSRAPRVHLYAEQSMGTALMQSGRYAEARGNFLRMREAARQAHSILMEAAAILGLSSVADGMGDRNEAEFLNEQAIGLFRRVGAPYYVSHAQHQLANMFLGNRHPEKALPLVDANAAIYEKHDNPIGLWWTLQLRSQTLQALGRLAQAREDAAKAYALAQKSGFNIYLSGSARRLSEVAAAQGDHEEAYRRAAEAMVLKEKSDREKTGERIVQLAKRFREESKQREIDALSRHTELQDAHQRQLLIVLAATAALLAVTVFFLLRLRRSQEEVKALNAGLEQRVMERTAELYESRQSLAEAQRIARVGSWELDHASNELTWSDEIYRMFGIEPQQFDGTYEAFLDAVHPDDREKVDLVFRTSLEKRQPYEIEHRLGFPDGRIKYVHEHCETTYDAAGRPLRSIGTVQDITERKEMENALRESRELLTEAQRIAHVGSWDLDLVSNVLTWSEESQRIFEIDPRQVSVTYEVFLDTIHPEDRDTVNRIYLASLENRTPYEIVHRLLFPDGRIKYVHEHCETFYSADGRPLRSIGTTQDITERKEMENALRESRQLMAEAQRIAQVGSWEYDIASDTHTWSDELFRIFEIDPAQSASYEGCVNATHPDDREAIANAYLNSVETGQSYESEHRLLMADGRIKYVHERGETVCGPDGTLLRAVGMMQDITERKLAEQKLKEALEFSEGVINAIPDILFEVDREGRYLNVWTQNPELLAAQRESLLGRTAAEVLSPENAAAAMRAIREADEQGASRIEDICIELPQGRRWFSHSLSKKPGGTAGEATFLVLSRDITERKLLEETLAERERELRALAESSPGMMGSYYLKPDGTVCMPYVSPNVYDLFGVRPEEIVEDAGPMMRLNHPDDAQRVKDSIAESARTMAPWHCEFRILHPVKGERWMEGNTNPQPHPGGGTIWYGHVHDITGRKRMEAALQESEARYRYNYNLLQSIIESPSSSVAIYAIDREYRLLAFNSRFKQAAKRLWNADIVPGMSVLDAIDTEAHREFFKQGAAPVLAGNHGFLESLEDRVENGRVVREYHDNYGSPIYNDAGEVVGMTIFVLNTTERKEAELKLKEALEFSEGVINAIPDILFEVDGEGRYLNVWTHTPELLAAQKEMLLGNTVRDVLAPESAGTAMEALGEAESKGASFGKVIRIDLPQGANWFELSVSKKTGGTFLVLSRDITARKEMEAALSQSEARYRYHFNQLQSMLESSASVSVFALDREYRYLFFNKRHREGAKRIRGTDIEIGMNMVETIPDVEFREFCRQGFDRVLAGNIVSVESKEKIVKDGKPAYEYNDNFGSPIFNDAGEVVGLTVFAVNTTERKRLEAELRDSRNFLDSVIDAVPDPIFVKDRQHRWVLLNDANCRFTGLPREALIGKSDYDIFPREEADVFWEKDELVFGSGEVNLNEERFTSADGEEHFIQTKKTPFVSADGNQMLVGVIRDITERIHYETARETALAEARRLAELRSEFIAHMSHELRTPLNGILGYAQMLGRDGKLDGKQQSSVEVIRQSGEHLLALIEDILDLARIESGRLELDIGDIPLAQFLNVVTGMVGVRAKQKHLEFDCEFASGLPQGIRGDEKRLRQVLLNLLSNAVKFTDQGKVVLRVERLAPSRLAFTVADTGIGIASADREKIFQSFEQVSDARRRIGGTGLGLAISRQLVRLMGGDIEVESRMGEGSTFRFELELPEVRIEPEVLCATQVDMPPVEPDEGATEPDWSLAAPPREEMLELHRLALLGNMRDIVQFAERIAREDSRYRPFAERLCRLAEGYQSKAILAFVERLSK